MNEPVYILGAGRTDFKRNLKKEGKALRDVIVEAGQKAIAEAKLDPAEIRRRPWEISMPASLRSSSISAPSSPRSTRNYMEFRRCTPKRPVLPALSPSS